MCVNQLNDIIKPKRNNLKGKGQRNAHFIHKYKKDIINLELYKIVHFVLFFLIFALLQKQVLSYYIEIKVNQKGEQQIISNKYTGTLPSSSYVNGAAKNLNERKIQVDSQSYIIKLVWSNYINNFAHMFSDLENIIEVHIDNLHKNDTIFSFTFSNCINLKTISITTSYGENYAIKDMSGMFYNCQSLTSFSFNNLYLYYYGDHYYKSYCTPNTNCPSTYYSEAYYCDYRRCHYHYYYLVPDYKLYNKINMSYMFYNCTNLKSISVDSYTRQNISDMSYMFYNCLSLTTINLEKFSTSNYLNINLSYMFYNCFSLKAIKFNPTYTGIIKMNNMFYNCTSLTIIDLTKFTTGNNYIDLSYAFYNCYSLTTIPFHPTKIGVNNMSYIFYNCTSLESINLQKFTTGNYYINLSYAFYNCYSIATINFQSSSNFGVHNMSYMCYNCTNLSTINLTKFTTGNNYIDLSYAFYNCYSLTIIQFHPTKTGVNNMSYIFYNCNSLKSINLEKFITDNYYIDLSYSFYNCYSIATINLQSSSNFGVNNMSYMCYNCTYLSTINLTKFTTGDNYIDLSYAFYNCYSLTLIQFNPTKTGVNNMSYIFYNCNSLKSINLEKFITGNYYIDLSYAFYNCNEIETINFTLNNTSFGVDKIDYMFYNCSKLIKISFKSFKIETSNYLNMSYLFYNCQSLTKFDMLDNYLNISEVIQMFYDCFNLEQLIFYPYTIYSNITLSKMFYNCKRLQNITFNLGNSYFYPNDMHLIFYNCISLENLNLHKFDTSFLPNISYLLYNKTKLITFNITSSNFSNDLITDMRGIFQNCESLVTLDLTNFYTSNVTIMWDMFKGCSKLQNLTVPNFDTSKVIDMQSMFSGCKNLSSLDLSHFNTTDVQYMNEMFLNCENLRELNMLNLISDSLSSMYRMFYNCKSLEYLNIFNLTEDVQSITEMFEGSSNNFTICIKDEKNIPNIYNSIYDKITRDCSSNCYDIGNERNSTQNNKSCCTLYEYNNTCYNKCPSKTKIQDSTNICKYFNCTSPLYYNYKQNNCTDDIQGYYQNDTNERTIDKCHEDCKTCESGPNDYSTNCLICKNDSLYVYLGNCLESCRYGYFNDSNGIKKCLCHKEKGKECTEKSLKHDLCISCNEEDDYYEKSDDNINISNFKNCYKFPEKYYLNRAQKKYMPCYPSCKFCFPFNTNKTHHYCQSCNEENSYSILDENNSTYMNCYPECKYNYYFNKSDDYNYTCSNTSICPLSYPFLIDKTKQCVETCKNITNKWEFRHTCFEQCPIDSKNYTNETGYYCNISCPFERPFELVEKQYCVSSCTIMERYNKLCYTNYAGDRINEVQDMILSDFKDDIVDEFNYSFITFENHSLVYIEKNIIYEITSTNLTTQDNRTTTIDLGECEYILKDYYGIDDPNKALYIFKVDALVPGKIGPKVEYEVYYPFDNINLHQLDLSICEGKEIFIGYLINIPENELDLYNNESPYYTDLCYPYTNSKGTDVTLNDRQIEYINNNKSFCDENCKPNRYDSQNGRLICSCEVQSSILMISQINIDKNKLYRFIDLKQMANFKVLKCMNLLLSNKGFKDNYGFYSFFPTLLSYFIALFILSFIEFKKLKKQIHKIISAKKILVYSTKEKSERERKSKKKKHKKKSEKSFFRKKKKQNPQKKNQKQT